MSKSKFQQGFGVIEGLMIVVALVIVGAVGYVGYNTFMTNGNPDGSDSGAVSSHAEVPTINSDADLDKAAKSVDDTSYDKDGAGEVDSLADQF